MHVRVAVVDVNLHVEPFAPVALVAPVGLLVCERLAQPLEAVAQA